MLYVSGTHSRKEERVRACSGGAGPWPVTKTPGKDYAMGSTVGDGSIVPARGTTECRSGNQFYTDWW
jgi:hypothetical protein